MSAMLFLTGCTSVLDAPTQVSTEVNIPHDDPQWQNVLQHLQQIGSYRVKGQFGYISAQPKVRFSSSFEWQYHHTNSFEFTLSSRLSNQSFKLHRSNSGLTISDNKGHQRTESNADQLMEEVIGTRFPIDQFGQWLKGLPSHDINYRVNEKRELSQFVYKTEQQHWKVSYIAYHEDKIPHLPKLIILENQDKIIKIRLDKWVY